MEEAELRQKEFLQKKLDYQKLTYEKQSDKEEEIKQNVINEELQTQILYNRDEQRSIEYDCDKGFYRLNYHIRKYILGFITFKQLKRMLYINKQMHKDILNYFRTHLKKLHVTDTLRFEMDGYKQFFSNFGQNLKNISIFCQGLNFVETFNSLPDGKIEGMKLIMCPSYWLQQRQFYRLLKLKFSKSLLTLQIQVYMQTQNNRQQYLDDLPLNNLFRTNSNISNHSMQNLSRNNSNRNSYYQKPVTLDFLKSFWSSFRLLKKISMKEVQTFLDLTADYNLLLQSIFTTPTLNLKVLKIQNMIIPFKLLENVQNNQQQMNNPQHSLQYINNNNNLQFQQNYHSLPIPNQLQQQQQQQSSSSSLIQPSQPQQNITQTYRKQFQIQQIQQQQQQLQLQQQQLIQQQQSLQPDQTQQYTQITNQLQQIQQQQIALQSKLEQIESNSSSALNRVSSNTSEMNNFDEDDMLLDDNIEYFDIEDTISFGERQIYNRNTLNKFTKLETLKIVCTRNSISFMGINDHTLECLIKLIPASLNRLDILDFQSEANLALTEKSLSEKLFVEFIQHFSNLTKLSINCYKTRQHISNFAFLHMTQIYNNLTSLGLASCNAINSGVLNELISRNCPQLQELCMDYTQLERALEMIAQSSTAQLKRLSINYCKRITKEEIITFCSSQNQLESVSFKQIKCFTKKALIPLVHNNYKTLKSVILEGNKIDNTHIAYLLRYCRQLQSLAIRKMDRVHANFSNQLFYMILQFAQRENYSEIHERLTYLDISYNSTFNDESISCIQQLFPNLYTFTLDSCSIHTLDSLLPLKYTLNSLNLSDNLINIISESEFEDFCKILSQFYYLNTIFIKIPNIDRFLKHSNFVWNSKPIIIKESYNMCCYPITRQSHSNN